MTGIPYVLTAHLGDVPGGTPEQTDHLFRLVRPLTVPIWRDAAALTAVSSHVARLAQKAYGLAPEVILNGSESRSIAPPQPDHAGTLRMLFVGRMSIQKNPVFLAGVFARMHAVNWRATFIGDGPLRGEFEASLRKAGVADRCEFVGWVGGEAVQEYLGRSDVLLLPSLSEGLPMAAIEAASRGVAFAGSDIPGLHDVVTDGENGWLLPPDASAWASALDAAAADPIELTRRKAESLRVAVRFDLGKITDQYERVLARAAGKSVAEK
jgi:glycosyltransferase involved in cell wall biosynthesis